MTTSLAGVLRKACKANKLSESGSSTVLLKRLLSAGKKATKPKPAKIAKKPKKAVKPKPLFKNVKNGGERLSAAAYQELNKRKLSNCKPQWIRQPNGSLVLKKIKMCKDAWGGRCAKWVNA